MRNPRLDYTLVPRKTLGKKLIAHFVIPSTFVTENLGAVLVEGVRVGDLLGWHCSSGTPPAPCAPPQAGLLQPP